MVAVCQGFASRHRVEHDRDEDVLCEPFATCWGAVSCMTESTQRDSTMGLTRRRRVFGEGVKTGVSRDCAE